jgi:hypothetical protein
LEYGSEELQRQWARFRGIIEIEKRHREIRNWFEEWETSDDAAVVLRMYESSYGTHHPVGGFTGYMVESCGPPEIQKTWSEMAALADELFEYSRKFVRNQPSRRLM